MDQRTKHIGTITGKILVFGGAYSNFQALSKLRDIAEELKISSSNVINTGDAIGYCAQPQECLELIKEWNIHSIAGNVELQIREGLDDCGCNFSEESRCDLLSRQWYPYATSHVSESMKEMIAKWPEFLRFDYSGKSCFVLHGSYANTSEFVFKSTPWIIKENDLTQTQSDVVLSGHCGLPFSDSRDSGYWLNAGVVGMPANDATNRVWYMILDDNDGFRFSHESFHYDHTTAAQLMQERGLPTPYAKTLVTGIWDNSEVLPEMETSQQGISIAFRN